MTDEGAFQSQVRSRLPRNYAAFLGHGLLGQMGMRLVNAPTFIPAYVHALAGFDAAVGIARGLQYFGMFLSPVLGATLIEHRRRVLPVGLLFGGLMRACVLGLALGGLLLPAPWALVSAWVFLGLYGFFIGVQGVVFSFLTSKLIPVELRGRLLGARVALAGVSAAVVALVAGDALLETNFLGNGYAATFLLAFALTSLGLSLLVFVREPASPRVRAPSRVSQRLRELPALLRSDAAFTRYFLARALAAMGRMALPFYVLYAGQVVPLGGSRIGALTSAWVLAECASNLLWGLIADRHGFRVIFLASLSLWILAVLLLMEATGFPTLLGVYATLGAGFGGFRLSSQNLVLEFGSRENLPLRIAVANAASELVAAVGAVAGGLLAAATSYVTVFWSGIAFQLAALAIVALWVEEPRHR